MGWSRVVHENRRQAELQRAREELQLRRRGYDVEAKPSAGTPAALALAGLLSTVAWWRREGRKPGSSKHWKRLPGISHLLEFINPGGSQPKARGATRGKAKPKQQLVPPGKAAAARQAAAGAGAGARPLASAGGMSAAGAAAAARASGRKAGAGAAPAAVQQLQQAGDGGSGADGQQGSSSNKAKKKSKPKKKKK